MKKIYRLYVYNIKKYIYCVSSVTLINRFHLMVNCGILSREPALKRSHFTEYTE